MSILKSKSKGYKCKKSAVFKSDEIMKFLNDAADESYLLWKVIFCDSFFQCW